MDKIKAFFTKNLNWKLFSIITAIVLWFIVINIEKPMENRTYVVNLQLTKMDELTNQNLVIKNLSMLETTTIMVVVRGNRGALEKLDKVKNQVEAAISMQLMYGTDINETLHMQVNPKLPYTGESFEVYTVPRSVDVILERIISAQKPVQVLQTGSVADGYAVLTQPEVTPSIIEVRGPESLLARISNVQVAVDLNNETKDITLRAEPRVVDSAGYELTDVVKNVNTVEVNVRVNKYGKVPIKYNLMNSPAAGYAVTNVKCEPEFAEVVGADTDVDVLKQLTLPPINVGGRRETHTFDFDLREQLIQTGISIKNGTPNMATVTVTIEPLERLEFVIPVEELDIISELPEDYYYVLMTDSVTCTVMGIKENIAKLTQGDIKGTVTITDSPEGIYEIPCNFTVPPEATLEGTPPIVGVEIRNKASDVEANTIDEDGGESDAEATETQ